MVLSIRYPSSFPTGKTPHPSNQLLDLLPSSERLSLIRKSQRIILATKTTIYFPGNPIDKVYFPVNGIISSLDLDREGLTAQTFALSNEGLLGISAFLGGNFPLGLAIARTSCDTISLPAEILQREFARGGELHRILLLYTRALFFQISQNVFCSCHHTLEQRLARWLLFYCDRLSSRELLLTQENLAESLGVRRSSLSVVATEFRQRSSIDYSRGKITVLNLLSLRKISCKCDRLIAHEYSRLLTNKRF